MVNSSSNNIGCWPFLITGYGLAVEDPLDKFSFRLGAMSTACPRATLVSMFPLRHEEMVLLLSLEVCHSMGLAFGWLLTDRVTGGLFLGTGHGLAHPVS